MSSKYLNTVSSTPKLDQLFASMRYYSPTKKTDQNSMIDTIRELGQEILEDQSKRRSNQQSWEKIQIDSQLISRDNSKEFIKTQKLGRVLIQAKSTKPSKNLYDKYKQDFYTQREKKLFNRTQQIIKEVNIKNPKMNKQSKYKDVAKRLYQKNEVNSLNYQKYVQKKVNKSRQQAKAVKQSFNSAGRQLLTNRSLEQPLIVNSKKPKIVIPQKNIFQRGEEKRMTRQSQIMQLKSQKEALELKGVTFIPQKIAKKQIRQGISKQERQRVSSLRKQIRDRKIINQMLQETTLCPKTNNYNAQSKIKNIWSSLQVLPKYQQKRTQKSQSRLNQSSNFINQKSIPTSGTFSVRNASQVKFLLN